MSKIVKTRKELARMIKIAKSQNGHAFLSHNEEVQNYVNQSEEFEDISDDNQMYYDIQEFQNSDKTVTITFLPKYSTRIKVKELKWKQY